VWSANLNLPNETSLQPAYYRLDVIPDKRGVGANGLQRARHDPFRLASPRRREVAELRGPLRIVFVPITHDLVHVATVHTAGQAADLGDEVPKEHGAWRKFLVVDVPVQGLVQSEDELRHATKISIPGSSE